MASIPPITILFANQPEEQPDPVSNVCAFPERVIAEGDIRHAKRVLAQWEADLENCDPNAESHGERLRALAAPDMVKEWAFELRKAEARLLLLTADDSMTYRGKQYRAVMSAAGAN